MNDPRFSNLIFQPSLVAQWIKAPVLVSDLHELKGSCPGFGEVSEDAQCVIANALQRSGGESELFNLCISEAKASPGWAPLTKIFFWPNNLFPPGFEPQTSLCEHTHSKLCATEDFTILSLKILIYIFSFTSLYFL